MQPLPLSSAKNAITATAMLFTALTTAQIATAQQNPNSASDDFSKEAMLDQTNASYYNKPNDSAEDFVRDWTTCQMIGGGDVSPIVNGGALPPDFGQARGRSFAANAASGIGTAIGNAALAAVVLPWAAHEARRKNRRACLLILGWRQVTAPRDEIARLASLPIADQELARRSRIGSTNVVGEIMARGPSSQPIDPTLKFDAPLTAPGTLRIENADGSPLTLKDRESAIVLAIRRTDPLSSNRTVRLTFSLYDMDRRELVERLQSHPQFSSNITYSIDAVSSKNKSQYEILFLKIPAGHYVITRQFIGDDLATSDNYCMGSPEINLKSGETSYVGDFTPYANMQLPSGPWIDGLLAWSSHLEDARRELARFQPDAANKLILADIHNGATYRCLDEHLDELDFPGIPYLASPDH